MRETASMSAAAVVIALGVLSGCSQSDRGIAGEISQIPGHDSIAQDTRPKQGPRLLPAEAYLRTYLRIFGGASPQAAEEEAKQDELFNEWSDYLPLLGLPDRARETGRAPETNALMLATFERLGIALCDRAIEHDWRSEPPVPLNERRVFAFEPPPEAATLEEFSAGFDVLHRTFLGYPAKLARTDRARRFHELYHYVAAAHAEDVSPKRTPAEAGWAAVCYGLARHPELHLY